MIDILVGKIASLFEKDFLFASFLPALLFTTCSFASFAAIIGLESAWLLLDSITLIQQLTLASVITLGLIAFAYILNTLRPLMARFWSGYYHFWVLWGGVKLGEYRQTKVFRELRADAHQYIPWKDVWERFRMQARAVYGTGTEKLNPAERDQLDTIVYNLKPSLGEEGVLQALLPICEAYKKYDPDELNEVFKAAKRKIDDWYTAEENFQQYLTFRLDRKFADTGIIRATRLGNIIESYNQYSSKRYNIAGEVFWPRLHKVIPKEYQEYLREPRIVLDFSLTMSTLSLAYGLAAVFIGPWLWYNFWFWALQAVFSGLSCYLFYRFSVVAAQQLGEIVRASFDLFRLDLLKELQLPFPASYEEEKILWETLSQLAVFGVVQQDFPLQPKSGPNTEDQKEEKRDHTNGTTAQSNSGS